MVDDPWLDETESRAWMAYIRSHRLLDEALGCDLKQRHGISRNDYAVLVALDEEPDGRIRMGELANRALVSPSRLSHQVTRMEAAGLVRRSKAPGTRGINAVLTRKGRSLLRRAAPRHVANVRALFIDRLGRKGVQALADLLEPIAQELQRETVTPQGDRR